MILLPLTFIFAEITTNPYRNWNESFILTVPGKQNGTILDGDGKHPAFSVLQIPITKQQFLFEGRNGMCQKVWSDGDPETKTIIYYCDTMPENGVGTLPNSINT